MFGQEEQLLEGVRVTDKLLGLRALFSLRISNPIYHQLPPPGFLLSDKVFTKVGDDVDVVLAVCDELETKVDEYQARLTAPSGGRAPLTTAVSILDSLRTSRKELQAFDHSISHKLQQFRVKYSEDDFPQEVWQPPDAKEYPRSSEFTKAHLLPALRHNPTLKRLVRRTEAADLELTRLFMKRLAVKTAAAACGMRSKPRSQRTPSKQRELKLDIIPQLVHFMPKLSSYQESPAVPDFDLEGVDIPRNESDSEDSTDDDSDRS